MQAADQKLASLEVTVDDKVATKTLGIRTLYVIVYDTESKMPMPYGAMKVELKADAKGSIYKGELTTANVVSMNPGAPLPKTLRLKARLDKDGAAGKDQPGDAVGNIARPRRSLLIARSNLNATAVMTSAEPQNAARQRPQSRIQKLPDPLSYADRKC
jgi:hypothetical protein